MFPKLAFDIFHAHLLPFPSSLEARAVNQSPFIRSSNEHRSQRAAFRERKGYTDVILCSAQLQYYVFR